MSSRVHLILVQFLHNLLWCCSLAVMTESNPKQYSLRNIGIAMFLTAGAPFTISEGVLPLSAAVSLASVYWWKVAQAHWMASGGKGDIRPEMKREDPIPKEYEL